MDLQREKNTVYKNMGLSSKKGGKTVILPNTSLAHGRFTVGGGNIIEKSWLRLECLPGLSNLNKS